MHESNTYEFTVSEKKEGKAKYKPFLMILAYIAFFGGCLAVFGIINMPMLFVIPIIVGLPAIPFTWIFTKTEYEYEMTSGTVYFKRSFDGRFKKAIVTQTIKEAKEIAPYDEAAKAHLATMNVAKEYLFVSSPSASDQYYMLIEENGQLAVVRFEATQQALKILRFYNENTVKTNVSR
jgi:hypothetical protein